MLLMSCNNPILMSLPSMSPLHSASPVLSASQYATSAMNTSKEQPMVKGEKQRKYLLQVSQIVADLELHVQFGGWQQVAEPANSQKFYV
jgi:hypothetical protein